MFSLTPAGDKWNLVLIQTLQTHTFKYILSLNNLNERYMAINFKIRLRWRELRKEIVESSRAKQQLKVVVDHGRLRP